MVKVEEIAATGKSRGHKTELLDKETWHLEVGFCGSSSFQ